MRTLLAAASTLVVATVVPFTSEARERHVCHFDQDKKVLAYTLTGDEDDVVRATCLNTAMLHMVWRYPGAGGRYPRGVLTLHGRSKTLAVEGPVQMAPDGQQALTISINTDSALVRLIRQSDVEVRHPSGGYRMQADKTGCIEALLMACIFWRPPALTTRADPN